MFSLLASVLGAIIPVRLKAQTTAIGSLVLASNTRDVKIDDGGQIVDWWLEPSIKPDIYTVAFPHRPSLVKYSTDLESHLFEIRPGQEFDFEILLNGNTTCYTRLSAKPRPGPSNFDAVASNGSLSIPFEIRSNRIYLHASFNDGPSLLFQLDLGAAVSVISHRASSRSGVIFDRTDTLHNTHGSNQARAGVANTLKVQGLEWPKTYVIETRNMASWEDGLLGANAFVNQVLELDYANNTLTLHATLPEQLLTSSDWTHAPIRLDGGVRPMVQVTLTKDQANHAEWMVLDTGLNGTMVLNRNDVRRGNLAEKFGGGLSFGGRQLYSGATVTVAGQTLPTAGFVGETSNGPDNGLSRSLLGNVWMRNFHTIIDFRQGNIWLSPSKVEKNDFASNL